MTDQDTGMTDADAAERSYRVPFVSIDEDGKVRVYAYDEKLRRPVVDEERTRRLDSEFAEHLKWLDECRKIHGGAGGGAAKTPSDGRTTGDTRRDFETLRCDSGVRRCPARPPRG